MSIEHDISFLETVPLFRLAGRAPLRVIALGAENQTVGENEMLFADPERIDAGFVVREGRFGLRGARERDLAFIAGPGALLGEAALISAAAKPHPVMALESSVVMRVPRALFLKMLNAYPDAALRLRDHLATCLDQAMRDVLKIRPVIGRA